MISQADIERAHSVHSVAELQEQFPYDVCGELTIEKACQWESFLKTKFVQYVDFMFVCDQDVGQLNCPRGWYLGFRASGTSIIAALMFSEWKHKYDL